MADEEVDELDQEDNAGVPTELDETDLDDDDLLDGDVDAGDVDDDDVDDDDVDVLVVEDELPVAAVVAPVAVADDYDEEEDEDEADEDDVEASLDVILKEKLVVADEDEDEAPDQDDRAEPSLKVLPKQPDEFVCQSCFLVKHPSQLADGERMLCRDCV